MIKKNKQSLIGKFIFLLRKNLRNSNKGILDKLYYLFRSLFAKQFGLYPFPISNEIRAVKSILISGNWNATYSLNNNVKETEESFSKYLNVKNCILVPSGGVGIEIIMRLYKSGNNNLICNHIRHICPASPFSILRGGVAPIPTNPSTTPFNLPSTIYDYSSKNNLALATHLWGYPEDIRSFSKDYIFEDCCLSFESYYPDGRHVGTIGKAGIFSFGCLKPIQAGEGGLICTNDDNLAREIRIMQNYANEINITGSRDIKKFGLNGRISCISSAIISEQLKSYKKYVDRVRRGVMKLIDFLNHQKLPISVYIPPNQSIDNLGFSSLFLEVDPKIYNLFVLELKKNGIETIPPFFDDLFTLTYFKNNILNDLNQIQRDLYLSNYKKSQKSGYVYPNRYILISRRWLSNFAMRSYLMTNLKKSIDNILL